MPFRNPKVSLPEITSTFIKCLPRDNQVVYSTSMPTDKKLLPIALVYDFDGTLAKGNCAEHGLLPALGFEDPRDFWRIVKHQATSRDADEILVYLSNLHLQKI